MRRPCLGRLVATPAELLAISPECPLSLGRYGRLNPSLTICACLSRNHALTSTIFREDLSLDRNGVPDLIVTLLLVLFALAARKAEKVAVEAIDTAQQTPQDYSVGRHEGFTLRQMLLLLLIFLGSVLDNHSSGGRSEPPAHVAGAGCP